MTSWQRELLRTHGLHPKKSLSQNFLLDETYLARIAQAAQLEPTDRVLEIGAGLGALTRHLAPRVQQLVAVEIDSRLVPLLEATWQGDARVRIVHQDILACDLPALLGLPGQAGAGARYKVVANLPYHAASRIIRHMYDTTRHPPGRAVLLVQEDVARRICAKPGAMSLLSVGAQFHADCSLILRIPPGAFYPAPKVRSAVVDLVTYPASHYAGIESRWVFAVARAGFSQKRKQLVNPLSQGLAVSRARAREMLLAAGVNPTRRAETLSMEEWIALTREAVAAQAIPTS